jgi:AraC-like DNA-binding protein
MHAQEAPWIRAAGGAVLEKKEDDSYHWDSRYRGNESYVIFQAGSSGEGCFEWKGQCHRVPAGHAFIAIVPENSCYYFPSGAAVPWEFSWINFRGRQGVELWSWLRDAYGPVIPFPRKSPAMAQLQHMLRQTTGNKTVDEYQMSSDAHQFFMAVAAQLQASRAVRSPVQEVVQWIQRQPARPLAVKELADRAGMSREHFTRLFTREMGLGPAAYRRRRQLQYAADWLLRSELSVGDIAARCGFVDGRQLTKRFRHHFGLPPLEYRQRERRAVL